MLNWAILALVFIVISELVWKAIGLWAAAKRNDRAWYVVMFILNTAGILPIVYLKLYTDFFSFKKKSSRRRR